MQENEAQNENNTSTSALQLWLAFVVGLACMILAVTVFNQRSSRAREGSGSTGSPVGTETAALTLADLTSGNSQILKDESASPPVFLGVEVLQTKEGIVVDSVAKDSPAQKGGIERGDVIVRYDSRQIEDIARLQEIFSKSSSGDRVRIDVKRNGSRKSVYVKLESLPSAFGEGLRLPDNSMDGRLPSAFAMDAEKNPGMKRPMTVPSTDGEGKTPPTNRPTIVPGYDNSGRTAVPGYDDGKPGQSGARIL